MNNFKRNIFITITLGWSIRNFFQTNVIKQLCEFYNVKIITTNKIKEGIISLGYESGIEFITVELKEEPFLWKIIRQLKKKLYMESRNSSTEQIWRKYTKRPLYQKFGENIFFILKKLINPLALFNIIDKYDTKILNTNQLDYYISKYSPRIIFVTHLTNYTDEYIVRNAIKMKIPIIYMVMSWDHLSSKVILNNYFNNIFVWNEVSFTEILNTYKKYNENQIKIVGIPQFDIYFEKTNLSYYEWCKKLSLDPEKETIFYTAAPLKRHDQQGLIIETLLKSIEKDSNFPIKIQVLFKCHPLDDFQKYKYLENFSCVKVIGNKLSDTNDNWIPAKDEIEFQRDCLYFCKYNINIFSTVTLEAAFFNKPIIHIAFDPLTISNRIPCYEYYNFEHFKPITDIGASILVHNNEELKEAMITYHLNPNLHKEERQKLVNKYWHLKGYPSKDKIVNTLIEIESSQKNEL